MLMKCLLRLMPEESDYEQLLENSCSLLTDLLLDSHHPTVPDDKLLTMVYAKVGRNYITPFDDQYICNSNLLLSDSNHRSSQTVPACSVD